MKQHRDIASDRIYGKLRLTTQVVHVTCGTPVRMWRELLMIPKTRPLSTQLAPDIQLQIRNEFRSLAKRDNELDEAESKQVEEWIGEKLGVAHLPIRLKSSWIRFFRDKVRDHLFQWFRNSELSRPDDFISPIQSKESPISGETEELRKLVLSVVREMTQQELSVLALPAKAVLRVARGFRK